MRYWKDSSAAPRRWPRPAAECLSKVPLSSLCTSSEGFLPVGLLALHPAPVRRGPVCFRVVREEYTTEGLPISFGTRTAMIGHRAGDWTGNPAGIESSGDCVIGSLESYTRN